MPKNALFTEQHHIEVGNFEYAIMLEIWKGNFGGALEIAVQRKCLTDFVVGITAGIC